MKTMLTIAVLPIMICSILSSCNKGNLIDKTIAKHINTKGINCPINLGNELDFEWDSLYFFSMGCSLDDIHEAMGYSVNIDNDLSDVMVFVYKGNIVETCIWEYCDNDFFGNNCQNTTSVIVDTDSLTYKTSRNNSTFNIIKKNRCYILVPIVSQHNSDATRKTPID